MQRDIVIKLIDKISYLTFASDLESDPEFANALIEHCKILISKSKRGVFEIR